MSTSTRAEAGVARVAAADGPADTSAVRQIKVRAVFGRREAEVEGRTWRFELRKDGLHVRRKRSRKVRVLSFTDLVHASIGQGLLKL